MNWWNHRFSQNMNENLSGFLPCSKVALGCLSWLLCNNPGVSSHNLALERLYPVVCRAEILTIFGRNDDFINSFWNLLIFRIIWIKGEKENVIPSHLCCITFATSWDAALIRSVVSWSVTLLTATSAKLLSISAFWFFSFSSAESALKVDFFYQCSRRITVLTSFFLSKPIKKSTYEWISLDLSPNLFRHKFSN